MAQDILDKVFHRKLNGVGVAADRRRPAILQRDTIARIDDDRCAVGDDLFGEGEQLAIEKQWQFESHVQAMLFVNSLGWLAERMNHHPEVLLNDRMCTVRWRTLAKLVTKDTWLWMMTGTPAAQSPEDAFGLARMINPDGVPRYKTAWKDKVMYQVSRFRWLPKSDSQETVFNALQPAIRYEKAQCLDLPDVLYQDRYVPLTSQATKYYKDLVKEMQIKTAGETISTVNAAAAISRLLQLSGGAVYTDDGNVVEFDVSSRLQVLKEVLDETSHKILVFVPYRHTLNLVNNFLNNEGITNEVISGDVTATMRANIFNRFQTTSDPKVLLIQPQAASHGVTLTAADTIIFWSPVMSVETYLQCVARIDRVGQKNKMTVIHLQGSEVEKRMYKMLQSKVDMHERLVDLYCEEMEESNE